MDGGAQTDELPLGASHYCLAAHLKSIGLTDVHLTLTSTCACSRGTGACAARQARMHERSLPRRAVLAPPTGRRTCFSRRERQRPLHDSITEASPCELYCTTLAVVGPAGEAAAGAAILGGEVPGRLLAAQLRALERAGGVAERSGRELGRRVWRSGAQQSKKRKCARLTSGGAHFERHAAVCAPAPLFGSAPASSCPASLC